MSFFKLSEKCALYLPADQQNSIFIYKSEQESPFGEGQNDASTWDKSDWAEAGVDAAVGFGKDMTSRVWFKGGQNMGAYSGIAATGGQFGIPGQTEKNFLRNSLNSTVRAAGKTLAVLGIGQSTLEGYESGGMLGACKGFVSGVTDWSVSTLAGGGVVAGLVALGAAALSWPVLLAGAVGGLAASFACDYFGLGEKVWNAGKACADFAAGIRGSGLSGGRGPGGRGPGGVDLRRVPRLVDLHKENTLLCSPALHTFFPLKVDWATVGDLVNNRILPPGFHLAADDIPSYILHECLQLIHIHEAPLLFSLHFGVQGNSDLYTVMHPALRHTLIGYILGYIDYGLKSYLNGGTYNKDFLRSYDGNATVEQAVNDATMSADLAAVQQIIAARLTTGNISSQQIKAANRGTTRIARAVISTRVVTAAAAEGIVSCDEFSDQELRASVLAAHVTSRGISVIDQILMAPLLSQISTMLPEGIRELPNDSERWSLRILETGTMAARIQLLLTEFLPFWERPFTAFKAASLQQIADAVQATRNAAREAIKEARQQIEGGIPELIASLIATLRENAARAIREQNEEIDRTIANCPAGSYVDQAAVTRARQSIQTGINAQLEAQLATLPATVRVNANEQITAATNHVNGQLATKLAELEAALTDRRTQLTTVNENMLRDYQQACTSAQSNVNRAIANLVEFGRGHTELIQQICPVVVERIHLSLLKIPTASDFRFGVVGGCGLSSSEVSIKPSLMAIHNQGAKSQVSSQQNYSDGKRYFHWYLPIEPAITHGCWIKGRYLDEDKYPLQLRARIYSMRAVCDGALPAGNDGTTLDSAGNTLAHHLVLVRHRASLELLGGMKVASCNIARSDGFRPFDVACACGNVDMVACLLNKGITAKYVMPNGLSPLLIACQANHISVAVTIMNQLNSSDATICVNHTTDTKMSCLHWAVSHNSPTLVAELVSRGAVLIGSRSDSATPLHLAMAEGYSTCAEILLYHFAQQVHTLVTSDKRNVLHHAAFGNSRECVRILHTMDDKLIAILLQQEDIIGQTPLDVAVLHGYHDLGLEMATYAKLSITPRKSLEDYRSSPFLAHRFSLTVPASYTSSSNYSHPTKTASEAKAATAIAALFESSGSRCHDQLVAHIKANQTRSQDRTSYLDHAVCSGSVEMLKLVTRSLTLIPDEEAYLLRSVATKGLLVWMQALKEAGVSIIIPINAAGHTILDIAASKDDLQFFTSAWKEVKRMDIPLPRQMVLLSRALIAAVKSA
jgi:ankyrin repeat protein/BMFP domain-containing protein YqiC